MANLSIDLKVVKQKLFPFKEQGLRSFFSSWLIFKGVLELVINLTLGRTSEKDIKVIYTLSSDIFRQHYRVPTNNEARGLHKVDKKHMVRPKHLLHPMRPNINIGDDKMKFISIVKKLLDGCRLHHTRISGSKEDKGLADAVQRLNRILPLLPLI